MYISSDLQHKMSVIDVRSEVRNAKINFAETDTTLQTSKMLEPQTNFKIFDDKGWLKGYKNLVNFFFKVNK